MVGASFAHLTLSGIACNKALLCKSRAYRNVPQDALPYVPTCQASLTFGLTRYTLNTSNRVFKTASHCWSPKSAVKVFDLFVYFVSYKNYPFEFIKAAAKIACL